MLKEMLYEQGKDLHVRKYIAYANANKLYADAEHTKGVTAEELKDAYMKGALLIVDGADTLTPVGFSATGVVCVGSESNKTYTAGEDGE